MDEVISNRILESQEDARALYCIIELDDMDTTSRTTGVTPTTLGKKLREYGFPKKASTVSDRIAELRKAGLVYCVNDQKMRDALPYGERGWRNRYYRVNWDGVHKLWKEVYKDCVLADRKDVYWKKKSELIDFAWRESEIVGSLEQYMQRRSSQLAKEREAKTLGQLFGQATMTFFYSVGAFMASGVVKYPSLPAVLIERLINVQATREGEDLQAVGGALQDMDMLKLKRGKAVIGRVDADDLKGIFPRFARGTRSSSPEG